MVRRSARLPERKQVLSACLRDGYFVGQLAGVLKTKPPDSISGQGLNKVPKAPRIWMVLWKERNREHPLAHLVSHLYRQSRIIVAQRHQPL
jgi:hypothetical protein